MVAGQPLPSWETMAIAGLLIVLLAFMLCTILVCRKNRNLKDRLHRSAEVHAPTITQPHGYPQGGGSIVGTTDGSGSVTYSNNGHIYRPVANGNGSATLSPVHHATLHAPT